jgi:hypothetical protein
VLKGEVGVFTPRIFRDRKREALYFTKMINILRYDTLLPEEIRQYIKYHSKETREAEFLSSIQSVENGKIVYKPEYLSKKLGGLKMDEFERKLIMSKV